MTGQHHSKSRALRAGVLSVCLAGVVLSGGCGSLSPEQRVAKAREAYQKHDYHAAEVQLKTVLRKHPDNGAAWALLGHTSLGEGQYRDAIHQFKKAKSAGQPAAALALPLGRALLADGQFKQALDVLSVDSKAPKQTRAEVASLRGDALTGLNKPEQAGKAYATALSIDPEQPEALRGKAQLAIYRGDLAGAERSLKQVLSAHPDYASAQLMLGQVDYRTQRCDAAIEHVSKALKVGSSSLSRGHFQTGRAMLADCQLRAGRIDDAQKNIQAILAANQNDPVGNYLQALIDIRQGEYQQAANHTQATLNVDPQNLRSMALMAWIRVAQGRPDDAQPFLSRVLERAPDNVAALRLQAGLWMSQKQDQQARELIEKAYQRHPDQPGLHEVLSQVMAKLKHPDSDDGAALDSVALQLGLARSLAQLGSQAAAETVLGKVQPKTPAQKREVATARVEIDLASHDTSDAVQRAQALVEQHPDDVDAKRLLVRGYIAAGKYDAADAVLAKVQKTNTGDASIVRARAELAARRGRYSQAIDLLKPLHDANPADDELTLVLAGLYGRAGDNDKRIALLQDAAKSQSDASRLNQALARAYLAAGDADKAMILIDAQLKKQSNNPDWLQLKGVVQLTSGQTDAGIKTLAKAADQAPDQPGLALDVAKAQLSSGRTEQAIQRLKQLRQQSSGFWPAAAFLALAQAGAGRTDAALEQVDAVRRGGHAYEANMLDGDVLRQAKRYKQADTAYSKAFDERPSARLALAIFQIRRAGHLDDPAQSLRQWLSRSPGDGAIAIRLASWYQEHGNNDKAVRLYQDVLSKHDNAVVALNNLALLQAGSDPQKALSYARRAHKQAPDSPAIKDTLGWLLVNNDELDKGIKLLEQASNNMGESSPEISFHLGAALAQRAGSGDKAKAKSLLDQSLSAGLPDADAKRAKNILGGMAPAEIDATDSGS